MIFFHRCPKPTKIFIPALQSTLFSLLFLSISQAEPIKVGVPLALTGDLANCGNEMKNALVLANEKFGGGRYQLLFQDDRCHNTEAVSIARRFIDIDKIKYALGFMCNQTLVATAPIYDRAGVYVFSGSGTSGDIPSLGKRNFRFFPSDVFGAKRLFRYIKEHHKSLSILSELTEYSTMMDRTFVATNQAEGSPLKIDSYQYNASDTDLKTLLLKIKSSPAEAFYINADSDASYNIILKQLEAINFSRSLYAVYLTAAPTTISSGSKLNNKVIFSNLPLLENFVTEKGKEILVEYSKRFGNPTCGFPVVPTTLESFRVFDKAISSGITPEEMLTNKEIEGGFLPPYRFDSGGNATGFEFEMQQIKDGQVVILEK